MFGNQNAAAGASDVADAQAPSGSSTSGEADVDTATTTTPISDEEGIAEGESGPEVPEPTSTELDVTSPDVAPDVSPPENATEPIPEAANDNGIGIEALPANEPIEKSPAVNE